MIEFGAKAKVPTMRPVEFPGERARASRPRLSKGYSQPEEDGAVGWLAPAPSPKQL